MPDIVLSTLNAKYIHASFGLRYLMANLGGLRERVHTKPRAPPGRVNGVQGMVRPRP